MNLSRLMTVLEAVAIAGRPVSAAELHETTKLPVPTCYRLLQTLTDQHLLEDHESNNRFVIGERLVRIALLSKTDADVCSITEAALRDAAIGFGSSVFLSRFKQSGVSIIHVQTPQDPSISYIHPGLGFRPMHACSCSKAIAAFADDDFRESILSGQMKAYTEKTHTRRKQLEDEFEAIRHTGYAQCVEEIEVGVSSVAAPVLIDRLGAVFSVGCIGSVRQFTVTRRQRIGEQLKALALDMGRKLSVSGTA